MKQLITRFGLVLAILASSGCLYFISSAKKENDLLKKLIEIHEVSSLNSHADIVSFKLILLERYIRKAKSTDQENFWHSTRDIFRQTVTDTLSGKPAYCGEFSRLLISALRISGIKARRLYIYKDRATNHVLLEYYHVSQGKWILLNSFAASDTLENISNAQPLTSEELFKNGERFELEYRYYSYINPRVFQFRPGGSGRNIPYMLSWLMDEPYVIKFLLSLGLTIVGLLVYRAGHRR